MRCNDLTELHSFNDHKKNALSEFSSHSSCSRVVPVNGAYRESTGTARNSKNIVHTPKTSSEIELLESLKVHLPMTNSTWTPVFPGVPNHLCPPVICMI